MNTYKIFLLLFCIACTSKNRFDPKEKEKSVIPNSEKTTQSDPSNIKGTIEDVESDSKPYLISFADTPRWNAKIGIIQDQIFDIKLDLSFEKKLCFGILKRVQEGNMPGEFFVGEVNSNNQKIQVQFYAERNACTDNAHKTHNGRITMLLNGKEYHSCADFME